MKKILFAVVFLPLATALLAAAAFQVRWLEEPLFPADQGRFAWQLERFVDSSWGGGSGVAVKEAIKHLEYEYVLAPGVEYPTAGVALKFVDVDPPVSLVDLSGYSSLTFSVQCDPANTLLFIVDTFDPEVSVKGLPTTYRRAETPFGCEPTPSKVTINLGSLKVPAWWLWEFQISLVDSAYSLDRVVGLAIINTVHSPEQVSSNVAIKDMVLHERSRIYPLIFFTFIVALWVTGLLLLRQELCQIWAGLAKRTVQGGESSESPAAEHNNTPKESTERPVNTETSVARKEPKSEVDGPVPGKRVKLQSLRDKESEAVLRVLESEYTNKEMTLEYVVAQTGINRNKINSILKREAGVTFSAYLIKLRLEAASRLLVAEEGVKIADIARQVGYVNVTSFNRAFKSTYGCSPKEYQAERGSKDE